LQTKGNIAARAGRWSARHRKTAIFGWLTFVIVAFMVGGGMGVKELDPSKQAVGESGRAAQIVEKAFPIEDESTSEQVLVQSSTAKAGDPSFKAAEADVMQRLANTRYVQNIEPPKASADGHSALVTYEVKGTAKEVSERMDAPLAAVRAAQEAHPELRVEATGDATVQKAVSESEAEDFKKAEMTSLPLTLLILVLAFGAIVAAGVPVLLALTGVLATLGLMGPVSILQPVAGGYNSIILLIGLAVGVDYALFYLRRMREARASGLSTDASVEVAAATSGRAVLVSGLTVMVSMAGMYLAGVPMFESFATGAILVVAVSVLGSLTVLPAILSRLGDKLDKGRLPFHGRMKRRADKLAIWSRITDRVLRRPVLSAALAGGLLVALALPTLGMHTALPGTESLPRSIAAVQTFDRVQAAFPDESIPIVVAVKASDVTAAPVQGAIDKLESAVASRDDLYEGTPTVEVSDDRTAATLAFPAAGNGSDSSSARALDEMRGTLVPSAFGSVSGVETAVSGTTAGIRDFNDSLKSHMPLVLAFVVIAAFLLLLFTFRSIVIPLKAIALNLLSVGAAYGLLVLVFQKGWGESVLGFESTGAITAWLPPFLFVILFGLSMDYHVFILSRIKELRNGGMSTERAVSRGIKSTAGVVTSAALVMVGVFAIFGTLSSLDMKQMGVGLAAAVLIDATLIRGVLLPASMKLLGEWNWWLPRRLGWLPKLGTDSSEAVPANA
jgi:RND superfamily putative drug exporter